MEKYILDKIVETINQRTTFLLLLASLSWMVKYFYQLSKGEIFNLKMFLINNTFAILIGYSVSLIMPDNEIEKVIIIATSFIARDILGLVEIYWPKIFKQKIEEKFNLTDNKDKEW